MTLAEYNLVSKDGGIVERGKRKDLKGLELENYLRKYGVSLKDIEDVIRSLETEAANTIEKSYSEFIQEATQILNESIYKRALKTVETETGIMAYIVSPEGWTSLGLAKDLNAKALVKEFAEPFGNELQILVEKIAQVVPKGKNSTVMKHEEVADLYLEQMIPAYHKNVEKDMHKPPAPLLFKGDNRAAARYVDFVYNPNPKLNKYMEEFLSRMHNHEYFCGYLYCTFVGIEIQQLLYLYGDGQNGKSSFTKVLRTKTKSVANYSTGKHHFADLEGKAFIILSEGSGGYILRDSNIKKITGKDLITIDQKYKSVYSSRAQGTIIVDSNHKPYVLGELSETRRLRPFEIQPIQTTETMDAEVYTEKMGEDFNGFLNYCRICYEKLKQPNGILIKDPPDLKTMMENFIDPDAEVLYDEMLEHLNKRYHIEINPSLEISSNDLRLKVFKVCNMLHGKFQDKYFLKNFIDNLRVKRGIREQKGMFLGLGFSDPTKDKEILAALPNY